MLALFQLWRAACLDKSSHSTAHICRFALSMLGMYDSPTYSPKQPKKCSFPLDNLTKLSSSHIRQPVIPHTIRILLLDRVICQMNRLMVVLQIELLRAESQIAFLIEPNNQRLHGCYEKP